MENNNFGIGLNIVTPAKGKTLFVRQGSPGGDGSSWTVAFQTITIALGACTSGRGDIIIVAPGVYVESLVIDKSDITLIGFTDSNGYPSVVPSSGHALQVKKGQRFACRGMKFNSPDASAVIQQANWYYYKECCFSSDTNVGLNLLGNNLDNLYTASGGVIEDCKFYNNGTNGLVFNNSGAGSEITGNLPISGTRVIGAVFYGNTNEDILDVYAGTNNETFINCEIRDCSFLDNKHGATYIDLSNGSSNTGMIDGCRFADRTGLSATEIDLVSGIVFVGNYDAAGVKNGTAL